MTTFSKSSIALALVAFPVVIAGAQQSQLPPIRKLGATEATAKEQLTNVTAVRHLSDGRVMVNDPFARRVLLFDPTLQNFTVVADSTSATANAYSGRIGGLIPFKGDSTLFVDPQSLSMLVLDPQGKVARVMSVPRTQDAMFLGGLGGMSAAFDGAGRLLYRGNNMVFPGAGGGGQVRISMGGGGGGGMPQIPPQPDTAPVVRIDLATRKLDTVAFVKVPKMNMTVSQDAQGRIMMTSQINPLPVVDDWAVMPDGSVALLRGRDYHVDWMSPEGSMSSSPKIPFEWQRLTDEDKVAFIDSVKAARERLMATMQATQTQTNSNGNASPPPGGARGGDGGQRVMVFGDGGGRGGAAPPGMAPPQLNFIPAAELPDYKPAFLAGSTRADLDGNLWIRTIPTKAYPGGPIYDVVNRKGELVDRVQVPAGRQIIGFGPGGVVYLLAREGNMPNTPSTLERAKVK